MVNNVREIQYGLQNSKSESIEESNSDITALKIPLPDIFSAPTRNLPYLFLKIFKKMLKITCPVCETNVCIYLKSTYGYTYSDLSK